jgi:hypothetical protein
MCETYQNNCEEVEGKVIEMTFFFFFFFNFKIDFNKFSQIQSIKLICVQNTCDFYITCIFNQAHENYIYLRHMLV